MPKTPTAHIHLDDRGRAWIDDTNTKVMDFAYEGRWTAQQIVEAFPWDTVPRYLLRDRDAIYSVAFQPCIKNMGIEEVKIALRSPWQNPYGERLIGSIRRNVLDHVIVLNGRHLGRMLTAYISYYHRFRTPSFS